MANLNKSTTRHKINYLPSVWIQYENKLLPKLMDSSENVSDPWSIRWKIYISTKRFLPHTDIFQRMVRLRKNSSVTRGTCAEIDFKID